MTSRRSNQSLISNSTTRLSHTGSKSGLYGASSKRNVVFDSKLDKVPVKKNVVQVFDDNGYDVTPKSLLSSELTAANLSKVGSKTVINFNDSASVGTPSELLNQSMFGASTLQNSYAAGFSKSIMSSLMGSSRASLDSVADEISEPSHMHGFAGLQEIEHQRAEAKEVLSPSDLKKKVYICLEDSETIWHLDIPGTCINHNKEDIEKTKEKNQQYEQLCATRGGNDMYIHRGMQTFNDALKTKEMQTTPVGFKEIGCMATVWDMYDTYHAQETSADDDQVDEDIFMQSSAKESRKSIAPVSQKNTEKSSNKSMASEASFVSINESMKPGQDTDSSIASSGVQTTATTTTEKQPKIENVNNQVKPEDAAKILKSKNLKEHLFVMERTIVQNLYHSRQAMYRGNEDLIFTSQEGVNVKKEETKLGPNMSRLWSYECNATKGLAVTCMMWNKVNHDLLAVGYGENDFQADGKGMTCVWSLKNPEHPERMFTVDSAVISIDFSRTHPNFLAVGLYNGTIAVFNIRNLEDTIVLDNVNSYGKHGAPVWQLRWVERDKGNDTKDEVLISSSSDGRVTQWSIKKGFEYQDLMKLKRVSSSTSTNKKDAKEASKKNDALISRFAACMCFDFHPKDANIYLAGTEEGYVHKCSCSYNEQFLETYEGHKSSVYRTSWSPFDDNVFLSCSSDWTVRLWHCDKPQPCVTFQASANAIIDIDWSPLSSVIFAAINKHHIEIWDLSVSTLDPLVINLPVTKVDLTSLKFSLNSESLLVGDSEGHVTIYQLREMNLNRNEQKDDRLSDIMNSIPSNDNPSIKVADEKEGKQS